MRVLIAGGGTGGHIYPGIAIARYIIQNNKESEVFFVGTDKGLESIIVPKEGFRLFTITVSGFKRRLSLELVKSVGRAFLGTYQAFSLIRKIQPDMVIGTGGYVCGPVLISASILGIPTLIHEQNVIPGLANRTLSRFVDAIAVSFKESVKYFPKQHKVNVTGNPLRPEILDANRNEGIKFFGLDDEKKTVLIFGGSRGARILNKAVTEYIIQTKGEIPYQMILITGNEEYDGVISFLANSGIDHELKGNIIIKPYLYNMQDAIAAADLVVSRAGAMTISEITAIGKPSVLIPLKIAANNHQMLNAKVMEKNGASVILEEDELNSKVLFETIGAIIDDAERIKIMAACSKTLGKPEATREIYCMINSLCKNKRS
jgi:UDP-N-acetylglucosamine--N-acetylmuramyl-(pentapeptide) pyrophosphoryl-undecaprenol N-acetylglucosamine transferase